MSTRPKHCDAFAESTPKVMVCAGYFDLATPYFAAEYTLNHMGIHPETQKCITWQFYEAGHMMYIDKACHAKLKRDITDFIHAAAPTSVESSNQPPESVAVALADPPSEAKVIEASPQANAPTVTAPPDSIFEKSARDREVATAFYKKYIDVGGCAPWHRARSPTRRFMRTHYIVTHMLAGRPDILQAMAQGGTRLIIIGKDQVYTDMPEYRNHPNPALSERAVRGTGGLDVTSFGEENLLNLPLDRYDDESIAVHEFCHTIDAAPARHRPDLAQAHLGETYKHAVDKGLWKNAYAGSQPGRVLGRNLPVLFRLQPRQQLEPRPDRHARATEALRSRRLRTGADDVQADAGERLALPAAAQSSRASSRRPPSSRSIRTTRSSPGPASSPCSARTR